MSAERQRRYRERKSLGLGVYKLELPDVWLEEWLIEEGWLQPWARDDREAVERALAEEFAHRFFGRNA